ncbi:MAG: hypothetical protein L6420_00270 [Elusimicrobia bacterium]|nr:hypothetical protein [Elusimicrobiota bacterium]
MNDEMEILEPDWIITLKVWWSVVWRLFIYSIVAVVGFGILSGILLNVILGFSIEEIKDIGGFFGGMITFPISIIIVKFILNMEYKDFRIAIIKTGHRGRRSQDTGDKSQVTNGKD